ncbi:MAG: hypothetical protein Q9M20_04255 [Mariprofundaceae bacterium]|nr:hypothetical protein [Mariprofundaceae bacterium]
MQKINFPYLALPSGILFMLLVVMGSEINASGETRIPILSLLVMNEFAFFVSASATYIGIKQIQNIGSKAAYIAVTGGCGLLTLCFIFLGIQLWPI